MINCSMAASTRLFMSRVFQSLIIGTLCAVAFVSTASASHFRAGQITWTDAGGGAIDFTVQSSWRRSGYTTGNGGCIDTTLPTFPSKACTGPGGAAGVGDVIYERIGGTLFDPGDGSSPIGSPLPGGYLLYVVTSIDPVADWLYGFALDPTSLPGAPTDTTIQHVYANPSAPSPDSYLADLAGCCRVGTTVFNNGSYSVQTTIDVGSGNNSPVTQLPPIVRCPVNGLCEFNVPGSDADNDALTFRFSTGAEAANGGAFTQPPGASVDLNTGKFSWTTPNEPNGTLYSSQVTIEDGTNKVAVDFLLELGPADPNPPIIGVFGKAGACSAGIDYTVTVGDSLGFTIEASDPDNPSALDSLTLNTSGLPAGAATNPMLPFTGNPGDPVSSAFSWSPVTGPGGIRIVNFNVSNFSGGFTQCSVEIDVIENLVPTAIDDPNNMADSGETINIDVLANDQDLENDVVSITTTTPFSGGTATVVGTAPNFSVDYTSAGGFDGTDTFTYTITDDDGAVSNSATVTIEVDGSVAVTPPGQNPPPVFGGAGIPGSDVPLSASGAEAVTAGTSSVQCCTVRDWRVGAGNTKKGGILAFKKVPFDIGLAMSDPALADANCADLPKPAPGELVMPNHFGVHTDPSIPDGALVPADFRFGICVVQTDVVWRGPVFVDVVAQNVVDYAVNCNATSVDKQPFTAARTTDNPEFAEKMRMVTSDCDPRGLGKWSTWYFSPNVVHLTDAMSSKVLLSQMSSRLKDMIETMRAEGAVDSAFLNDVKSLVLDAEKQFKGGSKKKDPRKALPILDNATLLALLDTTPPLFDPYGSSASFDNPQAELVSHLGALRYGVCSELAYPNSPTKPNNILDNCEMDTDIVNALPGLAGPPP